MIVMPLRMGAGAWVICSCLHLPGSRFNGEKTMRKQINSIFSILIYALTACSVLALGFVIYFIVKEALPLFEEVSLSDFLLGTRWMPIAYTGNTSFGIFNFIAATVYVSFTAMSPLFFSSGAVCAIISPPKLVTNAVGTIAPFS